MRPSEGTCEKWQDVSFTADSECINGTLFLLSPNSEDTAIQWIPVSGNIPDDQIPPKIPLYNVTQVERRRVGFNRRYSGIFLRVNQSTVYGPFEFIKGGSGEFISKLRSFVDLQRLSADAEIYKVTRKTTTYQLPTSKFSATPMSLLQGVGTRFLNAFEGLRVSGDALMNGAASSNFYPDHTSPGTFAFLDPDLVPPANMDLMGERIPPNHFPTSGDDFTTYLAPGDDGEYQIISRAPPIINIPDLKPVQRKHPVTMEVWKRHLDREGRVTVVSKLQNAIYSGGIDPELRPIVWKYLFGYLKWDYTDAENAARVERKHQHYRIMRAFWKSMSVKQVRNSRVFRERRNIIEKDTYRTDRQIPLFRDDSAGALTRLHDVLITYTFYNNDLGYFQGMNDLLAVIMTIIEREEDAFWCFAGLLEFIADNFSDGPSSLYNQFHNLFKLIEILMPNFAQFLREKDATSMSFCFKWFLIIFKREFSYDDIKILWEALFSGVAPKNFHLLIAVAIFDAEADSIMRTCQDMSQILQYINNLSEMINLNNILSRAQGIFNQLSEVRDRLPEEVAVFLGFAAPPSSSRAPGTSQMYSSFGDDRHRSSVDDEGLLTTCNFDLEAGLPPSNSSPHGHNANNKSISSVEVGEDATNLMTNAHAVPESSEDP
nr:TBC1 domain family 5 [Hymenolepis microstoma]